MNSEKHPWDMSGVVVLLPWGAGDPDGNDAVRCGIQQMGGDVAHAEPPFENYGNSGCPVSEATHEYVESADSPTELLPFTPQDFKSRLAMAHVDYANFLEGYAKPAYIPVMGMLSDMGKESRYFGNPWMPHDMEWPRDSSGPMPFVLQLDTAGLPGAFRAEEGEGELLLFFYSVDRDQQQLVLLTSSPP